MTKTALLGLGLLFFAFLIAFVTNQNALPRTFSAASDYYDDDTHVAQRAALNLISGAGITVTGVDDPANGQVDFTIAANLTTSTLPALTSANLTLGDGVTALPVDSNVVIVTGDGGANTIATITGGVNGQLVTLIFVDGLVTITGDDTHGADSADLSAAFTSADDTTLQLVYNGTSWYEVSRSSN